MKALNQHKPLATKHKGRRKPTLHRKPFKEYPKTFENLRQNRFEQTYISKQLNSAIYPMAEYTDRMRALTRDINVTYFRFVVEFVWLNLQFIYRGKRRKNLFANGPWDERAYGYFMREVVGTPMYFLTRSRSFFKVASYIDDLFPDFLKKNPFEDPEAFTFPYQTVSLDHLYFVYQMPERLELLKISEERGFNYNQFVDYVVNHVLSINEETGKDAYRLKRLDAPTEPPYVWHEDFRPLRMRYIKVPREYQNRAHG